MKIPKIIKKKKTPGGEAIIHRYRFVEKCNDNLFLYEEVNQKYKRCFTKFELGLVKQVTVVPRLRKNMNMKP